MKRIYLTFVMVAMLCSCGGKHTHTGHEHEHDHDHTEAHAHAHEHEHEHDHDHEGHDHEGHNHEAHEHDHGHEHAAGEIVFKKANAEAVGLMTEKSRSSPLCRSHQDERANPSCPRIRVRFGSNRTGHRDIGIYPFR